MLISVLFSSIIYQTSMNELNTRFDSFYSQIETSMTNYTVDNIVEFNSFRDSQLLKSQANLFVVLFYTNLVILVAAGLSSYFLARRSLKPIEQSHEVQSRFTSDASHELRTPLAVMKSELEVALRDKNISQAEMRELLESNLEEVNRLSELSTMLLQLSRSELSELDMEPIDMVRVVEKSIQRQKIAAKRIVLEKTDVKIYVEGNESSIGELFTIIIDNALRYSPSKSKVQVQVRTKGNCVTIGIVNDGQGIAPEDLPHIFDRFYRGEKSRTSQKESGYGLGLSLAKNIVELHNGSIKIDSVVGTTTSVTLQFERIPTE